MGRSNPRTERQIVTDPRYVMAFGKYKGETVQDILDNDPQYLAWLHHNTDFELDWKLLEVAEKGPAHMFSGFTARNDPRD